MACAWQYYLRGLGITFAIRLLAETRKTKPSRHGAITLGVQRGAKRLHRRQTAVNHDSYLMTLDIILGTNTALSLIILAKKKRRQQKRFDCSGNDCQHAHLGRCRAVVMKFAPAKNGTVNRPQVASSIG